MNLLKRFCLVFFALTLCAEGRGGFELDYDSDAFRCLQALACTKNYLGAIEPFEAVRRDEVKCDANGELSLTIPHPDGDLYIREGQLQKRDAQGVLRVSPRLGPREAPEHRNIVEDYLIQVLTEHLRSEEQRYGWQRLNVNAGYLLGGTIRGPAERFENAIEGFVHCNREKRLKLTLNRFYERYWDIKRLALRTNREAEGRRDKGRVSPGVSRGARPPKVRNH